VKLKRIRRMLIKRLYCGLLSGLFLVAFAAAADPQLHIDEVQAKKAAIDKPAPPYPLTARQLKISGDVHLQAVVAADGTVEEVRILDGNLVLTKPAAETVKKWRFKPFEANGKFTRALVSLSFEFRGG